MSTHIFRRQVITTGYHRRTLINDFGRDVIAVDTFMHGWQGLTAIYYLPGPRPAIIETGPGSSVDAIQKGFAQAGIEHLEWIVLTHIHLDHAGAVGHIAKMFPEARVVVRKEGAPHLVDPSRLWASASRLYQDMDGLWGEMLPVEEERIVVVSDDGPVADLGNGRTLEATYAPGHAKHQMALLETHNGDLFVGDAIGVRLPEAGFIRPATPPPDFDLEVSVETVERLRNIGAMRVFPTHYGPVPEPDASYDEAILRFNQWVDLGMEVFQRGGDVKEMAALFKQKRNVFYPGLPDAIIDKFENTTSYDLNAAGIFRYLSKRQETS